jgi:hypothetical protein
VSLPQYISIPIVLRSESSAYPPLHRASNCPSLACVEGFTPASENTFSPKPAARLESWGMSCYFHCAIYPHSEPRGFSNLLNPSRPSGDVQQHYVHGRPVSVYEENGRLYHAWKRGTYPYPMDEVCCVKSFAAELHEAYINSRKNEVDTTCYII